MSGLFRRLRRGPDASSDTVATEAVAVGDAPTTEYEAADAETDGARAADAPAATDHSDQDDSGAAARLDAMVGSPPTTRRRGRLRRRLRHLRRVREVLMRDLGGFVFELHRSAGDGENPVVGAKLERLAAVDAELRELEGILADRRPLVLREPGIGGACPACGELYGSQARYCWACGSEVAAGSGRVPELPAADSAPQLEAAPEPAAPAIEATAEEDAAPAGAESGENEPAADSATEVHRP